MTWNDELREIIRKEAPSRGQKFSLEDVYNYEEELAGRHPQNGHIRETIRDKLQELREFDDVEFLDGEGTYRRLFDGEDRPEGSADARPENTAG